MKFIIDYFKRLSIPSKQELMEYYPKYLLAHRNPINKLLHVFGNFLTVAYVIYIMYLMMISIWFTPLLLLTPFIVYVGAWPGHFKYEKNEPATFKVNPIITKMCDWIMIYELFTKKLKLDTRKNE
jgi:hypothetical protein